MWPIAYTVLDIFWPPLPPQVRRSLARQNGYTRRANTQRPWHSVNGDRVSAASGIRNESVCPQHPRTWPSSLTDRRPDGAAADQCDGLVFGPVRPGHQPLGQLWRMARARRRRHATAARTPDGQRRVQAQADQPVQIAFRTSRHPGESCRRQTRDGKCAFPIQNHWV